LRVWFVGDKQGRHHICRGQPYSVSAGGEVLQRKIVSSFRNPLPPPLSSCGKRGLLIFEIPPRSAPALSFSAARHFANPSVRRVAPAEDGILPAAPHHGVEGVAVPLRTEQNEKQAEEGERAGHGSGPVRLERLSVDLRQGPRRLCVNTTQHNTHRPSCVPSRRSARGRALMVSRFGGARTEERRVGAGQSELVSRRGGTSLREVTKRGSRVRTFGSCSLCPIGIV
jgi:hypothetical protein